MPISTTANTGYSVKDRERIVLATVGAYRSAMSDFASMSNLDVWYAHMDVDSAIAQLGSQVKPKLAKRAEKTLAKARTRDSMSAFSKLAEQVDGHARIVDQAPLIVPIQRLIAEGAPDEIYEGLHELLNDYRDTLEFDRRKSSRWRRRG